MNSNLSAENLGVAGKMRLPEQGNRLWQFYHRLPRMQQRDLKSTVPNAGFNWSTFLHDTKLARRLDDIPFGRLDFYTTFFVGQGFDNLFDIARQERTAATNQQAQAALLV